MKGFGMGRSAKKIEEGGLWSCGKKLKKKKLTRAERLLLVLKQSDALTGNLLRSVFGSPDPEFALRVCLRTKQMKARIPGLAETRIPQRKFPKGQNPHHLTPGYRKGESYHGGGWRNKLILKKDRHAAWHEAFDVMTLEEIIGLLFRCSQVRRNLLNAQKIEHIDARSSMSQAKIQRSRRRFSVAA